jgi:uncharacterized protein (DUF302 family)
MTTNDFPTDAAPQARYGFGTTLDAPFDETLERTKAALKSEGFGVLTTIDVRQTLKEKIDVDFERYVILGACNPVLAHRALLAEHELGLLLPCNVIVHEHGEQTAVSIIDPAQMLGFAGDNPALAAVAEEANVRLHRVVDALNEENAPIETL